MRLAQVRAGRVAAAAAVLAGLMAAGAPGAGAASGAPAGTSGNLIAGGNGEAGYCTRDWNAATTIPGWTVTAGGPGVMCYSAARFRHPAGAAGRGFFSAGPYGDSAMTQLVRLGRRAGRDGPVTFRLSGWLGGWRGEPGYVTVSLAFLDRHGGLAGRTAGLPVVSRADRGGRTGFLSRDITGTVPPGATAARVSVAFRRSANPPGGEPYPRGPGGGMLDNLALTLSVPAGPGRLEPPRSAVPHFDHVFMIMMENTNGSAVLGHGSGMPFFHQLMARGTTLANYHAVYHPSDENYLAVAGGASYARGAIYWPDIKDPGRNLADELQARGLTWKAYEQGMGFPCNASAKTEFSYDKYYYPDDAPFINYTDVSGNRARCRAHLVDARQLGPDLRRAATTPDFAWIAADDYYDGESAGNGNTRSREVQDGWLRRTVTPILDSPAWRTQRSLLIITWDEASQTVKIAQAANGVATVLAGSPGTVRAGYVSRVRYDHYSTARTIEEALGLGPFTANDEYAVPVNDAFTRRHG
jgi:hypothetical protein